MVSQSITGKIYDNESTIKGIQIINTTQNITVFSNEHGDFTINASVNDSLKFTSLFHHENFVKVSETHFDFTLVVELKKKVNELGEVLLNDIKKPKAFNPIDYTQDVSFGLKEDMVLNAHLYKPTPAGGFDVLALTKVIAKLFKTHKPEAVPIKTISYKTFDSLFSHDRFFNKELLRVNLNIEDDFKPLFFEYCDARGLNTKLLEKENQIILLDSLMNFSKAFKTIISESKKE
jgi:hypothetical protein